MLISICIAVFLVEIYYNFVYGADFVEKTFAQLGFSLSGLLQGKFWTFLTSLFLHANIEHLILNMFALFFFGRAVESELGWKKMLLIFLASGFFGNIVVIFASLLGFMSPAIPIVGASAAIFGIMGTAMFVKPFDMIFYPYLIPVPLVFVAVLYALFNVAEFFLVLSAGIETNIAYIAHIGGLFIGVFFGFHEQGPKRGILMILLIFLILLLIPIVWKTLSILEITNYLSFIQKIFTR